MNAEPREDRLGPLTRLACFVGKQLERQFQPFTGAATITTNMNQRRQKLQQRVLDSVLKLKRAATIRLSFALVACLAFGAGLFSSSVNGDSGKKPARDAAGARAAFLEAYKVFTHPRCLSCHPAGDQPLQGDNGRPHFYRVRRGVDGAGVFAAQCRAGIRARGAPIRRSATKSSYKRSKSGWTKAARARTKHWHNQ